MQFSVNDYELVKEVSIRDEFQDRPHNFLFRMLGNAESKRHMF